MGEMGGDGKDGKRVIAPAQAGGTGLRLWWMFYLVKIQSTYESQKARGEPSLDDNPLCRCFLAADAVDGVDIAGEHFVLRQIFQINRKFATPIGVFVPVYSGEILAFINL